MIMINTQLLLHIENPLCASSLSPAGPMPRIRDYLSFTGQEAESLRGKAEPPGGGAWAPAADRLPSAFQTE